MDQIKDVKVDEAVAAHQSLSLWGKTRRWIRHHPLVAFFGLTFLVSWSLGFTYYAVFKRGQYLWMPLVSIATCAPGLVGILITTLSSREPRSGSKRVFWSAFALAWAGATAVMLGQNIILNKAPFSPMILALVSIITLPVAFILSAPFSRRPALRQFLASMIRVRRDWGWLLGAVTSMVGIILLASLVSAALGRQPFKSVIPTYQGWTLLKIMGITFIYQLFFYNLTGEEVGWRGFALPRLQAHISPLLASLVLTVIWSLWHAFYWGALGDPVLTWGFWSDTFIRLFPATVIINWFYTRSRGSILVAGVTHAAANTLFTLTPDLDWTIHTWTSYGFVLLIVLADRMWRKLPENHSAVVPPPRRTTPENGSQPLKR